MFCVCAFLHSQKADREKTNTKQRTIIMLIYFKPPECSISAIQQPTHIFYYREKKKHVMLCAIHAQQQKAANASPTGWDAKRSIGIRQTKKKQKMQQNWGKYKYFETHMRTENYAKDMSYAQASKLNEKNKHAHTTIKQTLETNKLIGSKCNVNATRHNKTWTGIRNIQQRTETKKRNKKRE